MAGLTDTAALAQNEQFIPGAGLSHRAVRANGIPFADGFADYFALINARDGGINGVKLIAEECETGYLTDRGIECYERLKQGADRRRGVQSALHRHHLRADRRAPADHIPMSRWAMVVPIPPTDGSSPGSSRSSAPTWMQADALIQYIAQQEGGLTS